MSCIGIGTGTENPGVSQRVLLGLGYGLENSYPSKTRTRITGTRVSQIYFIFNLYFILLVNFEPGMFLSHVTVTNFMLAD